jgi:hypothetical protein
LKSASLDDLYAQYPSLAESEHRITSLCTDDYNCVGWVPRELNRWYEPGLYWPENVPEPDGPEDLDCYVALFESWGFEICGDGGYEVGYLKIAIYAHEETFQHVAKQIRGGGWSSKGGNLHDFSHKRLDALQPCGLMLHAVPVRFMRRHDDEKDPQHLERTGLIPI